MTSSLAGRVSAADGSSHLLTTLHDVLRKMACGGGPYGMQGCTPAITALSRITYHGTRCRSNRARARRVDAAALHVQRAPAARHALHVAAAGHAARPRGARLYHRRYACVTVDPQSSDTITPSIQMRACVWTALRFGRVRLQSDWRMEEKDPRPRCFSCPWWSGCSVLARPWCCCAMEGYVLCTAPIESQRPQVRAQQPCDLWSQSWALLQRQLSDMRFGGASWACPSSADVVPLAALLRPAIEGDLGACMARAGAGGATLDQGTPDDAAAPDTSPGAVHKNVRCHAYLLLQCTRTAMRCSPMIRCRRCPRKPVNGHPPHAPTCSAWTRCRTAAASAARAHLSGTPCSGACTPRSPAGVTALQVAPVPMRCSLLGT